MSRDAGVLRDRESMERLRQTLDQAPPASNGSPPLDLATVEATSLHTVSLLVASAALERADSLGELFQAEDTGRVIEQAQLAAHWT